MKHLIGLITVAAAVAGIAVTALKAETVLHSDTEAKVNQLRERMRFTAAALEAYRIDTNRYPAHTTDPQWSHGKGALPADTPTFRRYGGTTDGRYSAFSLTTPIAYLTQIYTDPFSPASAPLAYVGFPNAWLLYSPGPDGKYDLDWSEFDPTVASQPPSFFAAYSYDASNGLLSSGDIWYSETNVEPSRGKAGSIELKASDSKAPEPGDSLQNMVTIVQQQEPWQDPDKAVELRKKLRFYETALESYFIDNNKFPPHTADRATKHGGKAMPEDVPTFQQYEPNKAYSLTTPLLYLSKFPADPYAQDDSPFAYVSFNTKWLLWSPGPDGKYDLDWTEFDWNAAQQSPEFFTTYSYDVTNGLYSTGDLWLSRGRVGSVKFP